MKKALAILTGLVMLFTVSAVALAEETTVPTFQMGVQFNMDMDQVMKLVNLPNPEIDTEETRGSVVFTELEYKKVKSGDGYTCDLKYLFVGNSLVAIRFDMEDGTPYETMKAGFEELYGKAIPFDAAKIGNGKYAIDDDGDLKDCQEMIEGQGFTIIFEKDHDGDVDITILDPTAAYINN
ncbi:MAG: hypothetical protein J6U01_10240 [Clostridia bacterium]|nr:hypothetical protein [Clostridia bacterium]